MARKRGNAEGSIYQRGDGRWTAAVTIIEAGRKRRVWRYASTQGEARQLLTKLKSNQDDGRPVHFDRMTLREWLDFWLSDFIKPNRSPQTYASYHHLLAVIPQDLAKTQLSKVQPERLQQLFVSIAEKGKGRTAELTRAVLRSSFNRAVKLRRLASNPVTGTDPIQFNRKEGTALTAAQAEALLSAARGAEDRLEDLWTLMICLGLRRGEALGLKPDDFQLTGKTRTLAIQRSLTWLKLPGSKEGAWIEKPPKTERSQRRLTLPQVAVDAVVRQLARRDAEKIEAGKNWRNYPHLFTTERGEPLHGSNIVAALHSACVRAKVPAVRVHDLRHTCGSFLAARGVPLTVIMSILGHTQVSTARRYLHETQEVIGAALEQVGELLVNRKPPTPAETQVQEPASSGVAVTVAVN